MQGVYMSTALISDCDECEKQKFKAPIAHVPRDNLAIASQPPSQQQTRGWISEPNNEHLFEPKLIGLCNLEQSSQNAPGKNG